MINIKTYNILVRIGGAVSAVIGCAALAGWLLELPRLASFGRGLIPMAPSTAILFIAYGVALLLARRATCDRRTMLFVLSIVASGVIISVSLFFLSIRGVFLDVELLGIKATGVVDGSPIGHMSPITAFTFLLISLSFMAVLTSRPERGWLTRAAWWVAVMLNAAYIMLILTYLLGTPMFYGGSFIPPAATTSLAFVALGIALSALSRPLVRPVTNTHGQEARYFPTVLIVFFIFLAAGIISAGYFYHRNHQKQYLAGIELQLSAIADLKMGELLLWRVERLADAGLFHNNRAFAALVKGYFQHGETGDARREIETWIDQIQKNRNYYRIFLLDAHGKSRLSLPGTAAEPLSSSVSQKAVESMRTGRILFADFNRNEFGGKIYLNILVPISDPARVGDALGVLVMRIDPEKYLYPFLQRWPNASITAETLLVRRDGDEAVFLNELKFRKNAALNLKFPLERTEIPAVMAALGREGIVRGIDYRGNRVLAVLRNIPDSPWHLVTRIDADEVYVPMRERVWVTVVMISAMLLSAGTGVGFIWRQQSESYYKRMSHQSALLRSIIDSIPDLIFYKDANSVYLGCNKAFERFSGRPEKEQVGKTDFDFFDHELAEFFRLKDREMLKIGQSISNEEWITYPDGNRVLLDTLKTPFYDTDGKQLGLVGISRDITERKQKEREIEEKSAELERFTYTVSHDLKSPLVTIKTFLGYLEEDIKLPDNPRVQQDLGFMHNAADKMSQLLDELLELSRVGRINNPLQKVTFIDLANEALRLDAGRISERGVTVEIIDSPVVLFGDRARLVEIWQNLVENAVKYSGDEPAPHIEIGCALEDDVPVFFVRDNGLGIDSRYFEKIFGLFEKLDKQSEGTGLGLALVRRIVGMYGGRIWVESEGEGHGSCFRFTLPEATRK